MLVLLRCNQNRRWLNGAPNTTTTANNRKLIASAWLATAQCHKNVPCPLPPAIMPLEHAKNKTRSTIIPKHYYHSQQIQKITQQYSTIREGKTKINPGKNLAGYINGTNKSTRKNLYCTIPKTRKRTEIKTIRTSY